MGPTDSQVRGKVTNVFTLAETSRGLETHVHFSWGDEDYFFRLKGQHRIDSGEFIRVEYKGQLHQGTQEPQATKYELFRDDSFKELKYTWILKGL